MIRKRILGVSTTLSATLVTVGLFTYSCGKETKTTTATPTDTSSTTDTGNTATTSANTLALAVPSNLAVSAFPQSASSTTLSLDDDAAFYADTPATANGNKTAAQEVEEQNKILQGKGDSCVSDALKQAFSAPTEETCYEFDQDMIPGSVAGMGGVARVYGTADGKNSKGEACLVAFARGQIVKIKDPLDRAKATLNAALCQATKDAKEAATAAGTDVSKVDLLPAAVGDSLDLSTALKNAFAKAGRTKEVVTSIKMTRLADVDSKPVYQTVFNITDDQSNERVFTMNHSPKDKTNEEYNGVLFFTVKPPAGKADPMAGPSGSAGFNFYVSIGYARAKGTDGAYTTSYEARVARFASGIDPISSTGVLEYNTGADFSVASTDNNYGKYKKSDGSYYQQDNMAASGFTYITASNNETTGEQKVGFWVNPGSSYKENARGMIFSGKPNTEGLMEGCANSGSANYDPSNGISIRRTLKEGTTNADISLTPRGFYHPFMNTENGGPQTCTLTTDGTTYKYRKVCTGLDASWNGLVATSSDAVDFVTKQMGVNFTSQCYKQNAAGLYVIDTAKTTGTDGYDVIKNGDAKAITPPKPPEVALQTKGEGKIDFKPKDISVK